MLTAYVVLSSIAIELTRCYVPSGVCENVAFMSENTLFLQYTGTVEREIFVRFIFRVL